MVVFVRHLQTDAAIRSLRACLMVVCGLAAGGGTVAAEGPRPMLIADPTVAAIARRVPMPAGPAAWAELAAGDMAEAVCRNGGASAGWVGLSASPPGRASRAGCPAERALRQATMPVGREVGVFATSAAAPPFPLAIAQLHRAAAPQATGRGQGAGRWRELDPALPDAEIRLLLPAAGTPLWHLLASTVLETGCLADPALRRIFDAAERRRQCGTMRSDGPVQRRDDSADPVAWLAARGAGAVAFLSYSEFLKAGGAVSALPLDGVLPTFQALTADRYPAVRVIYLSVGLPAAGGDDALQAAMATVAEDSIGPYGALSSLGIVPLSAVERVDIREKLLAMGGAR